MTDLTTALLEAHVQHALGQWQGAPLTRQLEELASSFFRWLSEVKLEEAVSREQILGVIDRYVIELRVSGGITELAGEMARLVVTSHAGERALVGDILSSESYEEFSEKVLAMNNVRQELVGVVARSTAFGEVAARVLSHGVVDLLLRRAGAGQLGAQRPLLQLAAQFEARLAPELERRLSGFFSGYIERHRDQIAEYCQTHLAAVLEAEGLRSIADDVWSTLSRMRLSEVFAFLGEQDLEDFVVLSYEFWLRFRKTSFFRQIIEELVSKFFEKYGQESVAAWIDDMGITEQMVAQELTTFLVPLFDHAQKTGFLEQIVRTQLEPFYRSEACATLLAGEEGLNP